MDTKTKILKILPYWLLVMALIFALESAALLAPIGRGALAASPPPSSQPQVLGASTNNSGIDLRGGAQTPTQTLQEIKPADVSNISAESFLVYDLQSGQVLLQKNPAQKLAIASLTKLMTALVAYNNSNLNLNFTIGDKDTLNVSPSLGLTPGDSVSALDIFNSMLIGSCNDAALALANFTTAQSGKNFVDMMNQQAAGLGMSDSNFANPLGFDNSLNYSTADDLKLLISATQKLSAFTSLGRRESYEFTGTLGKTYSTVATNILLRDHPDIQAIKTGFTTEANGAMATKVEIGGHEIVILVLDSQDRAGDTLKLKDLIESDFE